MLKNILRENLKLNSQLSASPSLEKEIEEWVVNSLKIKMIKKLDNLLEGEGKINARKVFLVPIFSIEKMLKHVSVIAPEMKTLFYKELISTCDEIETRFNI